MSENTEFTNQDHQSQQQQQHMEQEGLVKMIISEEESQSQQYQPSDDMPLQGSGGEQEQLEPALSTPASAAAVGTAGKPTAKTPSFVKHKPNNQIRFLQRVVVPAMWKHNFSWPFHKPVDAAALGLPVINLLYFKLFSFLLMNPIKSQPILTFYPL